MVSVLTRQLTEMQMSIYDFKTKTLSGEVFDMSQLRNQIILIVNVASNCGFATQYAGLERLYQLYKPNLAVLAFPCNQFGNMEPDPSKIRLSLQKYNISFPVMNLVLVNGENADPIFKFLKNEQNGILQAQALKWNFCKFLVGKSGFLVKRFVSTDEPEEIERDIVQLLL
ncbi:glutathione_peroxidase [Hexamita inflata]|uniref:Glutathione peroxidase n=1 Tax=Hexamita inflata TaxID=28002 RepID=A0ABP1JV61_9EUKA